MSYTYVPWRLPLDGRDPDEEHRASTPLELLFDLSFVVAVAAAAASLHHELEFGHFDGLVPFAMMFFGIWWAWLNYSWFASSYDTGDVVFRLVTFVILTGVLVLAAGVPRVFDDDPDFKIVVVGYLIMRAALVPMWLRVAHDSPGVRPIALRYAAGITVVQILWVARLGFPDGAVGILSFISLAVAEMAIPYWAENSIEEYTPWHVEHIVERFSLFTIIVLGEVILATTQAISATLDGHGLTWDLTGVIAGGLLLVLSLWWIYFKRSMEECINGRNGFVFGYAHYFLLGSVAALGAALATCVNVVEHDAEGIGPTSAALCVSAAVSVYLLALGSIHAYGDRSFRTMTGPVAIAALTFVAAFIGTALTDHVGLSVLLIGVVATGAVVDHQVRRAPLTTG
ncbi:low temperature requirement protein A [Nocardioides marmorisolisilvae]|uniref:Low temperature requirement protein A n=1 Tax=Nocardioides marmorisolisilvae TaxID=1542737 RepID=A0A3N0DUX1_9ACTN|nr:low temperature requirement protein A [Nocardioides marmorisolisilvae]RNL79429.1 low temperature requirement protein A [Nocardioides marmorisolisilvae]